MSAAYKSPPLLLFLICSTCCSNQRTLCSSFNKAWVVGQGSADLAIWYICESRVSQCKMKDFTFSPPCEIQVGNVPLELLSAPYWPDHASRPEHQLLPSLLLPSLQTGSRTPAPPHPSWRAPAVLTTAAGWCWWSTFTKIQDQVKTSSRLPSNSSHEWIGCYPFGSASLQTWSKQFVHCTALYKCTGIADSRDSTVCSTHYTFNCCTLTLYGSNKHELISAKLRREVGR